MSLNAKRFRAFMESVPATFSNPDSMEYLDMRALELLTGTERAKALDVLRGLLKQGDVRAVYAVEHLKLEELFGDLLELAEGLLAGELRFPEVGVAAMVALQRVDKAFIEIPVTPDHLEWMDSAAKLRLADIRAESQASWEDILLILLRDHDAKVRRRAARSLCVRAGLGEGLDDIGSRAWVERMWLCIPLPRLQNLVLAELPSIAAEIQKGMHAKSASMSPELGSFLDSLACPLDMEPWGDAFDVASLVQLRGVERDYIGMSLVSRLLRGESRAPHALMALGDPRPLAALREFAEHAEGAMVVHVEEALAET
ncbi:MAG: hypothetical protein ACON5B_07125 [Myxococcota bacterium]